ncbi:5' nucleotidase, NT5C type [Alkalithermobacter paradoxus]|uniref:5' nucleotidase, NT5C type n=1 Tax=Alkalithermobacter paradoxus TaxID=29349 RepID=UPI002F90EB67
MFVLGSHYKVGKAKELRCDIFIEDSYKNAIELSNAGFTVILMDTNYNRLPINERIIRVSNWQEIYEIIANMELENAS